MLEIRERVDGEESCQLTLTLPFEDRQRSRLRVVLSNGEHAALALPRGSVLRGGDLLRASDGRVIRVQAAAESVSTARSSVPRALLRAAYHLGNRHVPLEIGEGYVRYQHDHVLDGMVRDLGLSVVGEQAPFEPEGGAYAGSGRTVHAVHSPREPHSHVHSHTFAAHHHPHAHDD